MNVDPKALWLLWTSQGYPVPLAVCEVLVERMGTYPHLFVGKGSQSVHATTAGNAAALWLVYNHQPCPLTGNRYRALHAAMRLRITSMYARWAELIADPATREWIKGDTP